MVIRRKHWTEKEIEFLKSNYGSLTSKEIGNKLKRQPKQIVKKAMSFGLKGRKDLWNSSEDDILREHFEWAPKNRLLMLLPNRTWSAITQRGWKTLGIFRKTQDKYDINYRFFEKWTPESAYVYGFILADGYLKYNHGKRNETSLQFELADKDSDILNSIKKVMNYEGPIRQSRRNTVKLDISNKKIARDLIGMGLDVHDKTHNATWPDRLPKHLTNHVIRGLFDGDGSIGEWGIQFLGTDNIIKNIHSCLSKILDLSTNTPHNRSEYGGANIWCVRYGGIKRNIIASWLYSNSTIRCKRKFDKYQELLSISK